MIEPELVRGILETELNNMDERHRGVAHFLKHGVSHGSGMGYDRYSLIGLVNMLKNLTDSSTIGPSMVLHSDNFIWFTYCKLVVFPCCK